LAAEMPGEEMHYLAALCVGRVQPAFHMTRILRATTVVLATAVFLCFGPPTTIRASEHSRTATTARNGHVFAMRLLRLQNAERRRHGLRRLKVSSYLNRASRRHARDMVRRHYFGHVSGGGRDVVDRVASTGYGGGKRFAVDENLYWWNARRSPAAVVRAWMHSAVHRANMLHAGWRHFGIGVVMESPYGRGGITVVSVYGARSRH
jgi:uncharacterized protein YkwD